MLIGYTSMTGNVRRFVKRLSFPSVDIREVDQINEPYILVMYTFHFGGVPQEVISFLKSHPNHIKYLQGVASSGNRNWGSLFAKSAETISDQFQVPILAKFELAGSTEDTKIFTEKVRQIEQLSRNQC